MAISVRVQPCTSCPYRRDVPSGIWEESEYDKLRKFDGDVPEQIEADAFSLFHCHQVTEFLCAGWVGCHDMDNNLAMRMNARRVDPAVWTYESLVPLFASGAEAADHGMREYESPSTEAQRKARQLLRLAGNRVSHGGPDATVRDNED